jgi:hypothetical protein
MGLYLCYDNHPEIAYETGQDCPLCAKQKELDAAESELGVANDKIEELTADLGDANDTIEKLNNS